MGGYALLSFQTIQKMTFFGKLNLLQNHFSNIEVYHCFQIRINRLYHPSKKMSSFWLDVLCHLVYKIQWRMRRGEMFHLLSFRVV